MDPRNRLIRTEHDRMLAGVCGGIAAYLAIDPLWVRIAFVVLTAASGIGFLSYVLLWMLMPTDFNLDLDAKGTVEDNWHQAGKTVKGSARRFASHPQSRTVVATALISIGIVLLVSNVGSIATLLGAAFWPLLGLAILVVVLRRLRG